MTDAPFTETHRETLDTLAKFLRGDFDESNEPGGYIGMGAAKTNAAAIDAALAEIDRLTAENEDMRKHLDGLFEIAHPEDGGA